MDRPSPTQLIGYLLDALEEDERAEVEQLLRERADLRQELSLLRRRLAGLEWARLDCAPPPGLAARTCQFIFSAVRDGLVPGVESIARPRAGRMPRGPFRFTPISDYWSGGAPAWSWLDLLVAACVVVGFLGLLFPALVDQRVRSQAAQCRENLRTVHRGISDYGMRLAGHSTLPTGLLEEITGQGDHPGSASRAAPVAVPRVMCCPTALAAFKRQSRDPEPWPAALSAQPGKSIATGASIDGWPVYRVETAARGEAASEFTVLLRDPEFRRSPCEIVPPHVRGWNLLFDDGHVVFLPPRAEPPASADFAIRAAALVDTPR